MEDKSFLQIIPLLWQHKKVILVPVIVAILLTSIVTLLMPNYYESSATFYPVNSSLLEPSVQINERSIDYYGDDSDVDRLLSIANSGEIAQNLINQFDLSTHYGISLSERKGQIRLLKAFKKRYKVIKTEYDAIELSIEDKDPEMAKKLTEAIVQMIDHKSVSIVRSAQQNLLKNLRATFRANQEEVNIISDSLQKLRQQYGIYNTESQAEALTNLEVRSPGSSAVKKRIDNYNTGIARVINLESMQQELNEGIAKDVLQIRQIEAALASNTSSIHMIEAAFVPIEKSRPRRSLYVLGAALLTGLFMVLLVLIRKGLQTDLKEVSDT